MVDKNKKDMIEMIEIGIGRLKEYQKEIKEVLTSLKEITQQNRKIVQSINVSDITKYDSNIQNYQKIPLNIELELKTFVSNDIDKSRLNQKFGELRNPKIHTERIHRSAFNTLLDRTFENESFPTGIAPLHKLECMNTEEVWIIGENKTITLNNKQGFARVTVASTCSDYPSDILISKDGHLR
ncbi:uncharacterized protein LOC133172419 [Saccostrea echinata]|uniref:uncharacterized protein LOC133172419 n=1 Tax=Saccostrea echinata TaxID=191078 RepID=UPI002A833854|nr:uncharacterized protein LOC133172419 [Saccostrea echinata]